ncbi:unnamed protein product [Rotaria socialis]|uniref:Uncharacterized protein n=1 Tax=Rotaria socialis TaxID=392032 RepID=A0A817VRZ8_9BILA|nr:unnamed protein product [Rotaria socialis]CAF4469594.1 unnamed protein product [Rotaria socialis]
MAAWNTGLFDCCSDGGICLYGWCCAPCLYGENAEKIDGSSCFGSCCIWYLLAQCSLCCLVHMGKRQTLRDRFGLAEDCSDCVATTFCAPCAICQEARELKFRSAAHGGPAPVVTQPMGAPMYSPYGQQGNMQSTYEQHAMRKQ